MKRRRIVSIAGGVSLGVALPVFGQTTPKVHRIGFLAARSRSTPANPDVYYDAFMAGLRENGLVEGKNLNIEWRYADGIYDRLPALAAELVRMNVAVLVTHSTAGGQAAQRATSTIPIVIAAALDVIGSGFSRSLSRPDGNITGLTQMVLDVTPKQVELLKTMVPGLARIAVLMNRGNSAHPAFLGAVKDVAKRVSVEVRPAYASSHDEIEPAFLAMALEHPQAVVLAADGFFISQRKLIAASAIKTRLPLMSAYREDVEVGALMSYGQNVADLYRRAASYVQRLLNGAKPHDLPIEQPMNIHLAINRRTATALGLTVPMELIGRANEVIE